MKELKHDSESYIITIRRKGHQSPVAQTITSTASLIKPTVLRDPQVEYESGSSSTETTEIIAPLPGIIVAINVKVGDIVREGQELAVLEAMKMENSIESPRSGTVRSIHVSTGDTVSEGKVIITIDH